MNINKAFREGKLSHLLYDIITKKKMGILNNLFIGHYLMTMRGPLFLLGFLFLYLGFISRSHPDHLMMIWGICIGLFVLAHSFFGMFLNREFSRIYTGFMEYTYGRFSPHMNMIELEHLVEDVLVSSVTHFEETEQRLGKMNDDVIRMRDLFKKKHIFFFELELCKEDWRHYFKLAETSLDLRER